jgi:flagella basal body P-ring formation protein FlgA
MARQAVPGPEDLEEVDFVGTPPAGALQSFPEGHRLKIPVIAGHVLTQMDIQAIPIIQAGDSVRVELVCGDLTMTLEATARSSAALGEKVRLEMPSGRKPMMAIATAPGAARVDWKG